MLKIFLYLFLIYLPSNGWSINLQEFQTKKGVNVWFVEDKSNPIISISFTFRGGSFFDPVKKAGTANFVASLLDEGSGNLSGREFQEKMISLGMKLSFSTTKDKFSGFFQTISENKVESFNLLKSALIDPSFDESEIEKIRNQVISSIKISESDIQTQSKKIFDLNFFSNHNFSRDKLGTLDSIKNIKKTDLENYHKNYLSTSNLIIGISGDISKKDVIRFIDLSFGMLPEINVDVSKINKKSFFPTGQIITKKITPQTAVFFGHEGINRNHEDFFAARIVNYVLGGGGFQSNLYKKIRVEKGLVYSIYSYLIQYENNALILGGFQTKNNSVFETIELVKNEWEKISNKGVSLKELEEAKSYFQGSFSRNFTSTSSISSLLNTIQYYNLGTEYITKRKKIIEDVTLEKVNKVSSEIFKKDNLYFSIVGDPKNEL